MKKLLALLLAAAAACSQAQVPVPVASYRWNFDQADINSSNRIFTANPAGYHLGDVVAENPGSQQGELGQYDQNGNSINFLAVPGSGVSSGLIPGDNTDRALFMPSGSTLGYITRTPNVAAAITDLGVITNFTITCWMRETGPQQTFARLIMFGPDGLDAGSASTNTFGILIYSVHDIQLKIHNVNAVDSPVAGQGITTASGILNAASTNWVFIAVSCDMTLPTGGSQSTGTNTWFYVGNRVDSLTNTLTASEHIVPLNYDAPSVNSVFPAATDGPGYVNFSPTALNGDGTPGVTNVYVAIGNRYFQNGSDAGTPIDNPGNAGAAGGNRPFNGNFDDVRLFANQVLTLQQIEAVRTNAPVAVGLPLTIVQQPQNTIVAEGQGAGFSAVASDAGGRTYQWYRIARGVGASNAVLGATSAAFETGSLTVAANNGDKYGLLVHSTDPSSDNGGAGVISTFATVTVMPTNDCVITPGMLKCEFYTGTNGIGGDSVSGFLNAPIASYPNAPDQTLFMPSFDTLTVFPNFIPNSTFVRISGWITPAVTTNYVFYIRAGSQGQLLLSSDNTTNNLADIADDTQSGPQLFYGPEETFISAGAGGQYSYPVALQAGSNYAVVAYVKANLGDNLLQVGWRMNSDPSTVELPTSDAELAERVPPISSSYLSCQALPLGSASITQQPASPGSVAANSKINLSVRVSAVTNSGGAGPLVVQWQENGANIDGATGPLFTSPYLTTADNGAQFGAVVSFPGVATNSHTVTVNVTADNVGPSVLRATADDLAHSVIVRFSEPVDPVTALDPANYSIPGLTVTSAAYTQTTNLVDNPSYDAVKVGTSGQGDNTTYTVTVHNVKDMVGNTIGANNSASFTALGFLPGFCKFSWYEDQNYANSLDATPLADGQSDFDGTVLGFMTASPKFLNDDPDTIVYPTSLIMTPQGNSFLRNAAGAGRYAYPPGLFATREQAIITPTNTGNYVFYLAAADNGVLWLSTDSDPANKHPIAFSSTPSASAITWSNDGSQTTDTNTLIGSVSGLTPAPTPWPATDGNGIAVITLTNGQRYYLEAEMREHTGGTAFLEVNWDNASGVAPADGTATTLGGSAIGWHFTQPQITNFASQGSFVNIGWNTNSVSGRSKLGAAPSPGVIAPDTTAVTASFPPPATLQAASVVTGPYTTLTNTSPATLPATNASGFFRLGE